MAKALTEKTLDDSTEQKIKQAARHVFHKKGFAATRTRDIAEEAGINLALLNYYFRSKEKLFDLIMMETMQGFFASMTGIFNDESTSLQQKVEIIADRYLTLLISEPDIPIFLLNELRNDPANLESKFNVKSMLVKSVYFKQWKESMHAQKVQLHPLHFLVNLMGLVMFPFVARPMLNMIGDLKPNEFNHMMEERKKWIPKWIKAMLKAR